MFAYGLILVLAGLLAELPQSLAGMRGLPVSALPGTLPGDETTRGLVLIGWALSFCGLSQMARAKGRHWGVAFLGLLDVPGALLGLIVVLLLKSRNPGAHTPPRPAQRQPLSG